jgi:2-iminobutanoate/2-iminopropanoate deaminase
MKHRSFILPILIFSALLGSGYGKDNRIAFQKEKFNLDKTLEDSIGYTHAVKIGNTVYISGTVGWGKMDDAMRRVYNEIGKTLRHYNAGFVNVVKENCYTTELDSAKKYMGLRRDYYGNDFPTATWVEVQRLWDQGIIIEIEVVAIVPDKR